MTQRPESRYEWIPFVLYLPVGIGLWFTGMWQGFEGGGAWTDDLMLSGVFMFPVGLVVEIVVAFLARAGKRTPLLVRLGWMPLHVLLFILFKGFGMR